MRETVAAFALLLMHALPPVEHTPAAKPPAAHVCPCGPECRCGEACDCPDVCECKPAVPSLNLPCRVVSVHDGDTLTVDVTLRANVRLLDCWAPELRERGGLEAKHHLRDYCEGKGAVLTVPLTGDDLGDVFTFGRVLGRVRVGGTDLSAEMVRAGHATKERQR